MILKHRSIINYVNLIKLEQIDNERVNGYIRILDAKSQRLKQLTEDLVETSRITSGNVKLDMQKIDLVELIYQTAGEFNEKFEAKELTIVTKLPKTEVMIRADGRQLYRVIENLYNNVAKYALEKTRVYVDVHVLEEKVTFSIKNVSERSLALENSNAGDLTERFIRGDASRTTEGSGLGLSIAKSLTQLMGGIFFIGVDGDLFKVVLGFAETAEKETKEKILQVAKENNYRPNLLARSLNHGRTMSLGVVTINIENMYFVQSLNTINKEADKRGYFTNIVVCDESLEWERKLIQGLAERQMEGILINPINKGKEFEEFLLSLHIPIVCIGNQVSGKITTVQVNEMAAAMDAVELIVSKGYKKIVFVCPPLEMEETQNIYVHKQREKGFKAAMAIHPELKMKMIGKTEFLPEVERICARGLHEKTAFLCSGDSYALSIMQWGTKKGLMIPKDFGLMGFDDISLLQYITPKLTTVSTNLEGVASTAVVELIQQIDSKEYSPKSIYLNYHILDRDTL